MLQVLRLSLAAAVVTVGALACAPTRSGGERADVVAAPSSRQGGTLKLAWTPEPDTIAPKFAGGSGLANYVWPFSSFLTYLDIGGVARPMLAQEIPTQANGGWIVNPDGTMITTYRLRPNTRWHDGTPLTAQDFVFAFEVYTDKEIPVSKASPEHLMERVDAMDDHTVVVRWKEPYVNANTLGFEQLIPLPRHTLQAKYRSDKATFVFGQEWTTAYVSTGPFKVERWTQGVRPSSTRSTFGLFPTQMPRWPICCPARWTWSTRRECAPVRR
ncbi:MAG: hypothetical protein HW416_3075 [Chloroflexi bacterium]|nr:hypothetical protein [Chloroflexota bacterium]